MPNGRALDGEATYEIVVAGRLDDTWSAWFHGWTVIPLDEERTMLRGSVLDQAALHGVLASVAELGLVLLSARRAGRGERVTLDGRRDTGPCEHGGAAPEQKESER